MKRFWMVYSPGNRAPIVEHDTHGSAKGEAERLAKANPGQQFVVLEAVDYCEQTTPVTWHRCHCGHVQGEFAGDAGVKRQACQLFKPGGVVYELKDIEDILDNPNRCDSCGAWI